MKTITSQEVIQRLKSENSWWNEPFKIPISISELQPRPYLDLLFPLLTEKSINRAVVLMGPRRVGKTVLVHHAIEKLVKQGVKPKSICYISTDHPIYNSLNIDNLLDIYTESSGTNISVDDCYFFLDEIQYMKEWERYLKLAVDRYPNIKFVVSGSAAAALRLKSQESGAGRFTDFMLPPLTFYEYLLLLKVFKQETSPDAKTLLKIDISKDIKKLNEYFVKYMNFGGYPEVVFSKEIQRDPGRFIKSDIIDKVLLRDLPSLYGIQDIQELNSLFTTLAYNSGNEVSLNGLSQNSGIAKNTIKKYIQYLEAAFLIRVVHKVDKGAKRFKRANFFKVYLTNSSMRTALFAPISENDPSFGQMVETAVFSQWSHVDRLLYYARWNSGEVDIVGLDSGTQRANLAVEIKSSDRCFHSPKELKSLLAFCHEQNIENATVTTNAVRGTKTVENVHLSFVPASYYSYIVGAQILKLKLTTASILNSVADVLSEIEL